MPTSPSASAVECSILNKTRFQQKMESFTFPAQSWDLAWALKLVRTLLYPSYYTFNGLTSLYYVTYEEMRDMDAVRKEQMIWTPIFGLLFLLLLPVTMIFLPLRCGLLLLRNKRGFMYSEKHNAFTEEQTKIQNQMIDRDNYKFGIATANLCIMPEMLSKRNHLKHVDLRCQRITERLLISQLFNDEWEKKVLDYKQNNTNTSVNSKHRSNNNILTGGQEGSNSELEGKVETQFSRLDFLMIQEAWSSYHNKHMIEELHKVYPYIIHDVGVHSYNVNSFALNSGLMIASRHPILRIAFKPFKVCCKHEKLISKGVLMVKILLGTPSATERKVGYLFNTHMQSFEDKEKILVHQVNELLTWTKKFEEETKEPNDKVMFSFVCGDFNLDNMSPADSEASNGELFEEYEDFARQEHGKDKPWTVGTEFRPRHLMNASVATPAGLKAVLQDPGLRQQYIIDADVAEQSEDFLMDCDYKQDEQGNVILVPTGGRRRIDYILYQKSRPVNVESYSFVTQLAQLTDHVPVMMEFTIPQKQT